MTNIVTVLISQQVAPAPETLQQTGAILSQGATTLSPLNYLMVTQPSDIAPYLTGALQLVSLVWSGGVVTATAAQPHGMAAGDSQYLTISGATPSGFNGSFLCNPTTSTQFTYPLLVNPGAATVPGYWSPEAVGELSSQVASYFGQNGVVATFVLELGPGSVADGVAALSQYIAQNPNSAYTAGAQGFFYSYLVSRTWDGNAAFLSFLQGFQSPGARTYFNVTMTLSTYQQYTNGLFKDVIALIESPATTAYPGQNISNISWSATDGGIVTVAFPTAHGVAPGTWFQLVGNVPNGYNGYWQALPGSAAGTLYYALAVSPGTVTTPGSLVASRTVNSGVGANEFSIAAPWRTALNWQPASNFRVPPYNYSYLYGVTPFPQRNNNSLLTTLRQAFVNVVATASEGGSSNTILNPGKTMDGKAFNYWYATDWVAINLDLALAAAVINGSNNPLAPLYYNQDGIDYLQGIAAGVLSSAVTFGLGAGAVVLTTLTGPAFANALQRGTYAGQIVINAVPFFPYLQSAPDDYANQVYKGFGCQFIPQLGFDAIVFSLVVTDFVTQ